MNRSVASGAQDLASPYYAWFQTAERLSDRLVETSPTRPFHVARAIERVLTVRRPRLRYVVGWRAALILGLRRYVPGELFERLYFGAAVRLVTQQGSLGRTRSARPHRTEP
jgi:hypothetical protein